MTCRREQGSAQEEFSNGAASVFTFPDAPSSAMSAISKHALIRRENLPEHMPLLHIPPLADVPGAPCLASCLRMTCLMLKPSAAAGGTWKTTRMCALASCQ